MPVKSLVLGSTLVVIGISEFFFFRIPAYLVNSTYTVAMYIPRHFAFTTIFQPLFFKSFLFICSEPPSSYTRVLTVETHLNYHRATPPLIEIQTFWLRFRLRQIWNKTLDRLCYGYIIKSVLVRPVTDKVNIVHWV